MSGLVHGSIGAGERMKRILALFLFLPGACVQSAPAGQIGQSAGSLPADVMVFVERRDGCDHFRNEDPYDSARAEWIRREAERLCTGTDAELARLMRRYEHDPQVRDVLARYEERVE